MTGTVSGRAPRRGTLPGGGRGGRGATRRGALAGLGTAACPLLLAACAVGGGQPEARRPERLAGKLVFWGQNGSFTFFAQGVGKEIMDRFRALHPELTLEVEDNLSAGNAQHIEQVLQYAVAGTMPDSLLAHRLALSQFGQQGLIVPLDERLRRSRALPKDDLWPSHVQDATWKGKLYGVTHSTGVWVLFLNTGLWREAGANPDRPPRTWEQLQDVARRVARVTEGRVERIGFHPTWNNGGTTWFFAYLRQLGGEFLTPDFKPAFNDERGTKVLEFMRSFVDLQGGWAALDAFQKDVTAQIASRATGWNFGSNRIATAADAHTIIATLDGQFKDLQYATAPLPLPAGGKPSGLQGGTALTIPTQSKQQDGAWLLTEHLMEPRNILEFSLALARIPSRRSVGNGQEYLQNDPRKRTFIEMVPHSFNVPPVPGNQEIAPIATQLVNDVVSGARGVREALREADEQTRLWADKWRSQLG
jgi:multiple sugar transport system substrate-binding protein